MRKDLLFVLNANLAHILVLAHLRLAARLALRVCTRSVARLATFVRLGRTVFKDHPPVLPVLRVLTRESALLLVHFALRDSFGGRRASTIQTTPLALPRVRQAKTTFATLKTRFAT